MANFLKKLAGDLLTLEVSTIVKEDMSAAKMPSSRRVAKAVVYIKVWMVAIPGN